MKRKITKRKLLVLTLLVFVCCIGGGIYFFSGKIGSRKADRGASSVQEAEAAEGEISQTIIGTGTLAAGITDSITIPSGLVIDEVKVENGDSIAKGDVLAVVNQTSVLGTIETVQEEIEAVDEQINDSKADSETETITAKVDGRVKRIYVSEDDDVEEIMVEKGALLLLSIDGTMAVDLENKAGLSKGDSVTVVLSDGSTESGKVANVSSGSMTIVFSDEEASINEAITVKSSDGTKLGSGKAYIYQSLKITATGGTVSSLSVSEGEEVESGDTLLVLDTGEMSTEYRKLLAKREALADSLQELLEISQTGTILVDKDGIIGEVNLQSSSTSSSGTGETKTTASSVTGEAKTTVSSSTGEAKAVASYRIVTCNEDSNGSGAGVKNVAAKSAEESTAESTEKSTEESITESTEENTEKSTEESSTNSTEENTAENGDDTKENTSMMLQFQIMNRSSSTMSSLGIVTPVAKAVPQTTISASNGSYRGTISWNPSGSSFAANTVYMANVTLTASKGYQFSSGSILGIQTGTVSGVTVSEEGSILQFRITFPSTASDNSETETPGKNTENQNKDAEDPSDGTSGDGGSGHSTSGENGNLGSGVSTQGGSSGESGSLTASGSESVSESGSSETDISYSTDVTAFTLASDENMILSVSVDELDINSVAEEQEAEVTLDAIEDETFTGTITYVSNSSSSSSGGVAKYTVEISIPKDERMKIGMNASATIVIEKREKVVTIPVDALQERGDSSYVYTSKDGEGNLSGETEVTTGLSDGENVEITEGLSAGTIVYYEKIGISDLGSQSEMPGIDQNGDFGGRGRNFEDGKSFEDGDVGGGMPSVGSPGQGGGQ